MLVVESGGGVVSSLSDNLPQFTTVEAELLPVTDADVACGLLDDDPGIDLIVCEVDGRGGPGLDVLAWARTIGHPATRILLSAAGRGALPPLDLERAAPAAVLPQPLDLPEFARLTGLAPERRVRRWRRAKA